MPDSLYILILILKKIDAEECFNFKKEHPLIGAVVHLANECLIGEDGHPYRPNIDKVCEAGFPVLPGEMDRFGWVTGVIELKRGRIVFG